MASDVWKCLGISYCWASPSLRSVRPAWTSVHCCCSPAQALGERPFGDEWPLESGRLMVPVSLRKWLPLFLLWVPHLQNGNCNITDFCGWREDEQDDAQHVVYLTSTHQLLALLFLDQHPAPTEVIAKGSLALVLNGKLVPRKEGAREAGHLLPSHLYLTSFLLHPLSCLVVSTSAGGNSVLNTLGTKASSGR